MSSNVGELFPKVLELRFEVSECKPLPSASSPDLSAMLPPCPLKCRNSESPFAAPSVNHLNAATMLSLVGTSCQGLTVVHFSAQPEPFPTHNTH